MLLTLLRDRPRAAEPQDDEWKWEVGAAVVRGGSGSVDLELGPADGPPHARLRLSLTEAVNLANALRRSASGGSETVLLAEE